MRHPAGSRFDRIPSLDGLRAVSILMVIVGHFAPTVGPVPAPVVALLPIVGNGPLGVSVFFVISGFLITGLLLREEDTSGDIHLGAFYFRRTVRIWPAYYTLLAVVGILALLHLVPTTLRDWRSAALFVYNFVGGKDDGWTLGHTWSLSVEEQFYLFWPACLALWSRRTALRLAVGIILGSPALRVLVYFLAPSLRERIGMLIFTRADTLMFGCVLALLLSSERSRSLIQRACRWEVAGAALLLAGVVSPLLERRWHGMYALPLGHTVEGLGIALVCAWTVLRPGTLIGRALNSRLLTAIGMRSYSLYLWQQLFVKGVPGIATLPLWLRLIALALAAEMSYRLVERPALRLKRFSRRRVVASTDAGLAMEAAP